MPCAFLTDIYSAHCFIKKTWSGQGCRPVIYAAGVSMPTCLFSSCHSLIYVGPVLHAGMEIISLRITFTVSATDLVRYSRYSQQPSAGGTVDTVLPSFVMQSFRRTPTGHHKVHGNAKNKNFPEILIIQTLCVFLCSPVVNRPRDAVRALTLAIMWT